MSLDVRRHLDWLLDKIEPSGHQIRKLQAREDVRMGIKCVWWSAAGHGGPALDPSHMRRMAALNLEISFDIYFFGDSYDPIL